MSLAKNLAKNFLLYLFAEIIEKGFGFLFILILARLTSVEQFGVYSFAIAAGLFLSAFADLGLSNLILRDLSVREKKRDTYWQYFLPARIALSLLTFIVYVIILLFMPVGTYALVLWILALSSLVDSLKTFVASFYRAADEARPIVYPKVFSTLTAAFLLGVVWFTTSIIPSSQILLLIASTLLFANALGLVLMIASPTLGWSGQRFPSLLSWRLPSFPMVWAAIRLSSFFLLGTLAYTFIARFTVLFLGAKLSAAAVGLFSSALTILSLFSVAASLFSFVLYRTIAQATQKNGRYERVLFTLRSIIAATVPAVGLLCIASEPVLRLLFGETYGVAAPFLVVLGFSVPFLFLNVMTQIMIVSKNREDQLMRILVIGAIFSVLLTLTLVHFYGILGAAISTTLSEIGIFVLSLLVLARERVYLRLESRSVRALIAAALLTAVLLFTPLAWYWQSILFVVLYAAFVVILGVYTRNDFAMLKEVSLR